MIFLAFILGAGLGMFSVAMCVVAGDADRCAECMWKNRGNRNDI